MYSLFSRVFILAIIIQGILSQSPNRRNTGRPPVRADHILCQQKHIGPGSRAIAIFNRSGEPCKTYCKVLDRGEANIVEYPSFNNIRCGPRSYRCIEGVCQSLTYNQNTKHNRPLPVPVGSENIVPTNSFKNVGRDPMEEFKRKASEKRNFRLKNNFNFNNKRIDVSTSTQNIDDGFEYSTSPSENEPDYAP